MRLAERYSVSPRHTEASLPLSYSEVTRKKQTVMQECVFFGRHLPKSSKLKKGSIVRKDNTVRRGKIEDL